MGIFNLCFGKNMRKIYQQYSMKISTLCERLCTHKVFIKDPRFNLNYHKFSIKSYVVGDHILSRRF